MKQPLTGPLGVDVKSVTYYMCNIPIKQTQLMGVSEIAQTFSGSEGTIFSMARVRGFQSTSHARAIHG
jgi:hypothetical protein